MSVYLTSEILRAWRRGQLSRGELLELAFDHLPEVCPHCREGFAILEAETVPIDAALLLGSWSILLARFGPDLALKEERALRDVAQLRRLPPQDGAAESSAPTAAFAAALWSSSCSPSAAVTCTRIPKWPTTGPSSPGSRPTSHPACRPTPPL